MEKFLFVKFQLILVSNPFLEAYIHSDYLGKAIFISLFLLSIVSWAVIVDKFVETRQERRSAEIFKKSFNKNRHQPLALPSGNTGENPYLDLYAICKRHTLDILNKNKTGGAAVVTLSPYDIDFVDTHLQMGVASRIKKLEKNLFVLSTVYTLAPFLGLLGTVWGILTTFGELQGGLAGGQQQAFLGGLSLALATTVFGLIDAIPALVGYNYFKNLIRDFQTEMEGFSTDVLATVELQYRKVDAV